MERKQSLSKFDFWKWFIQLGLVLTFGFLLIKGCNEKNTVAIVLATIVGFVFMLVVSLLLLRYMQKMTLESITIYSEANSRENGELMRGVGDLAKATTGYAKMIEKTSNGVPVYPYSEQQPMMLGDGFDPNIIGPEGGGDGLVIDMSQPAKQQYVEDESEFDY